MAASKSKFVFIAFAIAVGVGSLAGVRGFGRAFRVMLLAEARTLMAGDLSVRVFELPSQKQLDSLAGIEGRGLIRTQVTETVSMLSIGGDFPPQLVSVKAVDPDRYPFYGEMRVEPAAELRELLTPDAIAVSEDILVRLPLKVGDRARLGDAEFRIAAMVKTEPDRMAGSLNFGSRILLSRKALDRTGLVKPGSRAAQRHLFRLDPVRLDVATARQDLRKIFPNALIADYREVHPLIRRGLDRSERFLSLVSLIALIVGALGVAATMHAHLRQRLDSIAILKCLGARSSQVIRIYLGQTLLIGLAGGVAGSLVGMAVQAAFPLLIARYFSVTPRFHPDLAASGEAILIGLLTATLFTWPTLLGVRRVRPAAVFRRDMADPAQTRRARWFGAPEAWAARLVVVAAIAGLAAWLSGPERWIVGLYFAGGLLVSLLVLTLFAWGLLGGLRVFLRTAGRKLSSTVRHGVANLYRPGNQAQAVLVALGVGVMFTMTIYLIQHGLLSQILASAPPDMPNVFLINITSREKAGIENLLRESRDIQGKPDLIPTLAARLVRVNSVPLEQMNLVGSFRRFSGTRAVTYSMGPRPLTDLVEGNWWQAGKSEPNRVCLIEDTAKGLGVHPGTQMEWSVGIHAISAQVACVYRTEEVRMGGGMDFVFSPGTLDGLPVQYFAGVRMKPHSVAAFQRESFRRYPSVTVINGADVVEIIQQVVDQIALVVRFISLFAILAGVIILASSVAATRFRRMKEVAILKTLGATRRRVAAVFSIEFLILGAAAGLLGALLATAFSNLLLVQVLDAKMRIDWIPVMAGVALTAFIANAAGWLSSHRILGQKPLEVLRHE